MFLVSHFTAHSHQGGANLNSLGGMWESAIAPPPFPFMSCSSIEVNANIYDGLLLVVFVILPLSLIGHVWKFEFLGGP